VSSIQETNSSSVAGKSFDNEGSGISSSQNNLHAPLGKGTILLTNFVPPYILPLYQRLQKALSDFRVLVSTKIDPTKRWEIDWQGVDVIAQRSFSIRRKWRHPIGFADIIELNIPLDTLFLLCRHSPQIVISAELGPRTLMAALYRKFHSDSRLIIWLNVSEHTEKGQSWIRTRVRRQLLRRADALLLNGESARRYVQNLGVNQLRSFPVPYATNMSPFLAIPLKRAEEAERRLLFVGQLIERKGLSPLLSALNRWAEKHKQKNVELWILGDGPLSDHLRSLEVAPNVLVTWLGNVNYKRVPLIYAQAGILVFPTFADEWGLVVNEGLGAGLPVLGSLYSQSVGQLIMDGTNGWTFHPDQQKEFDLVIERALSTPVEILHKMRLSARSSVQHLTPELVAKSVLDAVRFVCSK